jgi:hypothetical protein
MATVHLGRAAGESGFRRLVAIKVLHPHLSADEAFVAMLLDEARIASRLHHPNVVPIVDVGAHEGLHYLVMEYVEGCSLFTLLAKHRDERPPRLIVPIVLDALAGLHAAHELRGDDDELLKLVHRDVSPHNVLVGMEGIARITDFGVARAEARIGSTRPGAAQVKGKDGYRSPEQLRGEPIDRRSDVFAAGVMLWCALTGKRLFFDPASEAATTTRTLEMPVPRPSTEGLRPPPAFDEVCLRALERDPTKRFASALAMEDALREAASSAGLLGTRQEVAAWMARTFGAEAAARRAALRGAADAGRAATDRVERDTPATIGADAPARSRRWVYAGAAAAALALAAGAAALAVGARATSKPVTAALPVRVARSPVPSAEPRAAGAAAPALSVVESPEPPLTEARRTPRVGRHTARRAPSAAPTTTTPPPRRWDEDSPFPPP